MSKHTTTDNREEMSFIDKIIGEAKKLNRTILFPESGDRRILEAVSFVTRNGIVKAKIVGNKYDIGEIYSLEKLKGVDIIDPEDFKNINEYIDVLVDLRKHRGMDARKAKELLKNPLYFGALALRMGEADGMVAGAAYKTDDVLKASFQIVQTAPGIRNASSAYILCLPKKTYGSDGVLLFSDCAINPDPNPEVLADIAQSSAETAEKLIGVEPKVAMLSFSTNGSANHEMVDKIKKALEILKARGTKYKIDGEMQVDTALVQAVAELKYPNSEVAGKANVLIFPDLNSGNIAYKLVQRLAEADAIGAVTQGMAKPVNDLSRGCSVNDIVNITAATAVQSMN